MAWEDLSSEIEAEFGVLVSGAEVYSRFLEGKQSASVLRTDNWVSFGFRQRDIPRLYAYLRAYRQRPDVKERLRQRRKDYYENRGGREVVRAYEARPEVKARKRAWERNQNAAKRAAKEPKPVQTPEERRAKHAERMRIRKWAETVAETFGLTPMAVIERHRAGLLSRVVWSRGRPRKLIPVTELRAA